MITCILIDGPYANNLLRLDNAPKLLVPEDVIPGPWDTFKLRYKKIREDDGEALYRFDTILDV